ncbi:hypothetical protein KM043_007465 [Ampulex compressa]|nr:hypothetical protein KM043_007465 [Ampulex compressa]
MHPAESLDCRPPRTGRRRVAKGGEGWRRETKRSDEWRREAKGRRTVCEPFVEASRWPANRRTDAADPIRDSNKVSALPLPAGPFRIRMSARGKLSPSGIVLPGFYGPFVALPPSRELSEERETLDARPLGRRYWVLSSECKTPCCALAEGWYAMFDSKK